MDDHLLKQIKDLNIKDKLFLLDLLLADVNEEIEKERQFVDDTPEGLEIRYRLNMEDDRRYFS